MKKVLCLIVALSMLLTAAVIPTASAANGMTGFSDVDGTNYETPVAILRTLGIMSGYADGSFHPYATVTRAEMAVICLHMLNIKDYGEEVSIEEVQFNDMQDHWARAAVAYARSLGIIDGHADGNFYPDEPVTYEQVIKMVSATLGYDYYATLNGGYPNGYLSVATSLNLTKGVGLTIGSYVPRGDVAKIVYNSLTADLMEAIGYRGNGDAVFQASDGKNILSEYYNTTKLYGIVQENENTGISGETTLDKGTVRIGDEIFKDGGTGVGNYLGYYISFYAYGEDTDANRTVIAYKVESTKNDYITIDADKIENVSFVSSSYVYEYWRKDGDKSTKSVKTSMVPLVIYNGVALDDYRISDIAPEYGRVTLIDNNDDGRYDLIDVMDYDVMVVFNASDRTKTVSASYSTGARSIVLEDDDEDYTVRIIDGDGNTVPFGTIKKGSVLHFAFSRDDKQSVRTVIVSNNTVTGAITGRNSDMDYKINGTYYSYYDFLPNNYSLSIGDEGTFYLGYDGKIAGFEGKSNTNKYVGMFITYTAGGPFNGGKTIRVLQSNGAIVDLSFANKVNLDGYTMSGSDVFELVTDSNNPLFGRHSDSNSAGKYIPNPGMAAFLYKTDRNNKITEMNTVALGGLRCSQVSWRENNFNYNGSYHAYYNDYGNLSYINDDATLFCSTDKYYRSNESDIYHVYTAGHNDMYWMDCFFYYYDDDISADFAVLYDRYETEGTVSYSHADARWNVNVKIVDRVIETYGDNHETGYSLVYWDGGSQKTMAFDQDKVDYNYIMYRYGETGYKAVAAADDTVQEMQNQFWRRGDMVNLFTSGSKIIGIESIFNYDNSWNDPSTIEQFGRKEKNHRYMFPQKGAPWTIANNWSDGYARNEYHVGRITSLETLSQTAIFNLQGTESHLTNEPIEGSAYRLVYDNAGYLTDVESVGTGALAEDQLVLARKQGDYNRLNFRVKEFFILYEPSQFTDAQKTLYSSIYGDYDFGDVSLSSVYAEEETPVEAADIATDYGESEGGLVEEIPFFSYSDEEEIITE